MQANACVYSPAMRKSLLAYPDLARPGSLAEIDGVFKALADPSRRQLVDRLHARGGQTLTELCDGLAMTRQAVAQHLQQLEEADLVAVQWEGRAKRHYFNPVPIHEIYERWIRKFERGRLAALRSLKRTLEGDSHG